VRYCNNSFVGASRRLAASRVPAFCFTLLQAAPISRSCSTDQQIVAALATSRATVEPVRQRFVEEGLEEGLEAALHERARRGATPKLSGKEEAHLVAVAWSQPPLGRARWSLRLLADKAVELGLCGTSAFQPPFHQQSRLAQFPMVFPIDRRCDGGGQPPRLIL
jgi:hypothetical protein